MSTVAFIESNTTGTGYLLIKIAIEKKHKVIFFTDTPEKYDFLDTLDKSACSIVIVDTSNSKILMENLKNIDDIIAIISTSELFVGMASFLAHKNNLFGPSPNAINICRDKYLLAQELNKFDVLYPKTEKAELSNIIDQGIHTPYVIKPRHGTGSKGVFYIDSKQDLLKMLKTIPDQDKKDYLIQEYIDGVEYSAEIICNFKKTQVISIVKKHLSERPYFVEVGHDCPAEIPDNKYNEIRNKLIKLLNDLGFDQGPVHIEFKITSDEKICIIEINPRLAGGMIPVALDYAYDINFMELIFDLYCGKNVSFPISNKLFSSIRFLIAEKNGSFKQLSGVDQAEKSSGVVKVGLMRKIGSSIKVSGNFQDRLAFVIAVGKNFQLSAKNSEMALSHLNYEID